MNPIRYRLVIFDFDGTIANSYPWFLSVYEELARKYRLPLVEADILEELRMLEIRQILKKYRVPLWKMIIVGTHLKKMMTNQINQISMFEGMETVIGELGRQGVILAVVTSNAEKNVRHVLGPEIMRYVAHVESGVSMFGKKSKFEKVLKKTGTLPEQAISIGDEIRDLKSSRDARIPFGAVSWGYTHIQTLSKQQPDMTFDHPAQILKAVFG